MPKNSAFCKTSSLIVQLPGKLIRLFLARDVWVPRSVTSPYFALTGQGDDHAMALRPRLLRWILWRAALCAALCARLRRAPAAIIPHLRWADRATRRTSARIGARSSCFARVAACLRILYHIPNQLSTATEYSFLLAFQRRYDARRDLRPGLAWSATAGSDPRSTSRLSLA